MATSTDTASSTLTDEQLRYVGWVESALSAGEKLTKRSTEKKAREGGITRQIEVKELTELAIVRLARKLAHQPGASVRERYDSIVALYKGQVNLSHRTSVSVLLQQYSTPAPLGYLMGLFCRLDLPGVRGFEPSAGNGLLTIAGETSRIDVNEIDGLRRTNLWTQGFRHVGMQDATKPFKLQAFYEAVLTNPPFGRLDQPITVGPATIRDLDHWMAINALNSMADGGRAAIIVGGHTEYDDNGSIKAGKNRYFLNYLYHHYHVVDTINIDGDLYKRQGTGFKVRLILIAGRKGTPAGLSRPYDAQKDAILRDFDTLYSRIMHHVPTENTTDVAEQPTIVLPDVWRTKSRKDVQDNAASFVKAFREYPREIKENLDIRVRIGNGNAFTLTEPTAAKARDYAGYLYALQRQPNVQVVYQKPDLSSRKRPAADSPGELTPVEKQFNAGLRQTGLDPTTSYWVEIVGLGHDADGPTPMYDYRTNQFRWVLLDTWSQSYPVAARFRTFTAAQIEALYAAVRAGNISLWGYPVHQPYRHDVQRQPGRWFFRPDPLPANSTDSLELELQLEAEALLLLGKSGLGQADGLDLASRPVTKGTMEAVHAYVWHNRDSLSNELKLFYHDVAGLIRLQLRKKAKHRLTMSQLLERAYNIEQYVLQSGAASYRVDYSSDNELGLPYMPASASPALDTETPDAMAADVAQALSALRARVGSVDGYVQQKLGYASVRDLADALAAEQIDAVALAIDNIERLRQGIIIGDQTGIGKGRQAAAMIRYAVEQGQTPVFITEKPNLFTDLYRDLAAIGSTRLRPYIINAREDKTLIRNEAGEVVHRPLLKAEQEQVLRAGELPAGYDFLMLTYSQLNSGHRAEKNGTILEYSNKARLVATVAEGSVVVLDESHNASGESTTGMVLANILDRAAGVTYLSATFAKRPDNMFIYAMKTAMREASLSRDDFATAFSRGGVPLQEVVAGQLVAQGQMIRRQRGFEGVEVNYISLDGSAVAYGMPDKRSEHQAISDQITRLIRRIIFFQKEYVRKVVKSLDEQAKAEQGDVELASGTKAAGVDNTPYFSKVFNVVNQMLFAIKAEAVAERAIQRLREGKKPVIAFSSTMGAFVEELFDDNLSEEADALVNVDFASVLQRGLDGVMRITTRDGWGTSTTRTMDLAELSEEGYAEYQDIARDIRETVSGLVLSPIDLIKQRIQQAGYLVAEVTGRSLEVQLATQNNPRGLGKTPAPTPLRPVGTIRHRKKENVSEAFRRFNNNEVDVLLINQSGSTGASAHAIATAAVPRHQVRQRVMIVLQAELDINREVQKRGRINRTGQLFKPIYDYVTSAIPAEKRLMMMLQKKLKSLDANTTSNQRNSEELMRSDDFLNRYGDKVVYEYLLDNRDINEALGKLVDDNTDDIAGLAHKASGRVAILPCEKQEAFYAAVLEDYDKLIRRLRERDEYDLEVETLDLQAAAAPGPDAKLLLVMGNGGTSPFGNNTYVERLEVRNLRKPYTTEELLALVEGNLAGRSLQDYEAELRAGVQAHEDERLIYYRQFYEAKFQKDIEGFTKAKKFQKIPESEQTAALAQYAHEQRQGYDEQEQKRGLIVRNEARIMRELVSYFLPGRMLQHEVMGAGRVACVVLGWSVDTRKKLPYLAKNVDCVIAVASSQKVYTLNLAQQDDLNTLRAMQGSSAIMDRSWDAAGRVGGGYAEQRAQWWRMAISSGAADRVMRHVVTGNLLQAYKGDGLPGKGRIVTFTTLEGRQRRGILLPESYSPTGGQNEDGSNSGPQTVDVPIQKAEAIIRALPVEKLLKTASGCTLLRFSLDSYRIITPRARNKDLYTDPMLLRLLASPDGFNSQANNMWGEFMAGKLADVLFVLGINHAMSVSLSQADAARIMAEAPADKGDDFLPELPAPEILPAPQPIVAKVDESGGALSLLELELELEAEALLLLADEL